MKLKRLIYTVGLFFRKGSLERGRYLREKSIFCEVGENVRYQPRLIPLYPELIKLHNNIMIAAGVRFITHDATNRVLNKMNIGYFPEYIGCIEIMDNVFVGYNCIIVPDVRIGENVIVGAGSVVTKDLPPNGVYAGIPARRIGSFDDFVKRKSANSNNEYDYPSVKHNQKIETKEVAMAWDFFNRKR